MLDQGRAGLNPIAAVVVGNVAEFVNGDAVDMSAKNCFHWVSLCVLRHCRLEFADKANGIFDALFHVGAERPITQPEAPANEIDERIKRKKELVTGIAEKGEPLHVLHNSVEL